MLLTMWNAHAYSIFCIIIKSYFFFVKYIKNISILQNYIKNFFKRDMYTVRSKTFFFLIIIRFRFGWGIWTCEYCRCIFSLPEECRDSRNLFKIRRNAQSIRNSVDKKKNHLAHVHLLWIKALKNYQSGTAVIEVSLYTCQHNR